mmetsp:Transcript_4730/g.8198  ORF Transcript_4730/g.8198 Transcript_4730/m.8198 type:complete len:229 (-) Transcript_4730:671-1357(-)
MQTDGAGYRAGVHAWRDALPQTAQSIHTRMCFMRLMRVMLTKCHGALLLSPLEHAHASSFLHASFTHATLYMNRAASLAPLVLRAGPPAAGGRAVKQASVPVSRNSSIFFQVPAPTFASASTRFFIALSILSGNALRASAAFIAPAFPKEFEAKAEELLIATTNSALGPPPPSVPIGGPNSVSARRKATPTFSANISSARASSPPALSPTKKLAFISGGPSLQKFLTM